MRVLIMSDSHGDDFGLRWLLEECWKLVGSIDAYIHLGDGALDFQRVENFIRCRDEYAVMYCVRGNCDFLPDDVPERRIIDFGGVKVFMTHGHPYRVKQGLHALRDVAREAGCDLVLYGHTHARDVDYNGPTMVNPGAVCKSQLALLEVRDGRPKVELLDV